MKQLPALKATNTNAAITGVKVDNYESGKYPV